MVERKVGTMYRRIALAVSSALLCALALPNELFKYGLWPLGFIALAPLYISLSSAESHREAALQGALYGGIHHALTSYWLYFYKGYALWTLGATTLAYAVVYAAAAMYCSFLLRGSRASRPFWFAVAWAAFEFLKSVGFLGYPWGLIPYSMTALPLMLQTADLTGVYGVSALLACSSGILGEFLRPKALRVPFLHRSALVGSLCLALALGYGVWRMETPVPVAGSFRALLVQQNTDPWISGEMAALESNLSLARKAYEADKAAGGKAPDIVVFSETSLRRPYPEFAKWFEQNPAGSPLLPFVKESGAHLLTGAPEILDWETYAASNSVLLIDPEGLLLQSYAKIHPVPFAEAIPLWEFAWFRTFMREVVGLDSGWVMGTKIEVFTLDRPGLSVGGRPGLRFGAPICFEDAFSDLCRQYVLGGADLLINLTNDSWSRTESAQIQHWAIARIRAIELRRTLVRSTNSGVTCVTDARGVNIFELPQFRGESDVVDVPVYKEERLTLFAEWGDWFAGLAVLLLAIRLIILLYGAHGRWPRESFAEQTGAALRGGRGKQRRRS